MTPIQKKIVLAEVMAVVHIQIQIPIQTMIAVMVIANQILTVHQITASKRFQFEKQTLSR